MAENGLQPRSLSRTFPFMTTRVETVTGKSSKQGSPALGRSAATGRFVLAPASKSGQVTLKQAKIAVASLRAGKK